SPPNYTSIVYSLFSFTHTSTTVIYTLSLHDALPILDFDYGENSSNDKFNADLSALVGAPTTAKIKLLGGTADVTYHFNASSGGMEGYLLGGLGFYNVKLALTSGGVTADSSETKFSWNVGAGLSFAVGSAAVFLESRYVDGAKSFEAAKTSFIPITAAVRCAGK